MTHRLLAKGGVDMEALSPRDANARQTVPKAMDVKTKATPQLKVSKEKDHPPPPPDNVLEPSSVDRPDGAVYQVGKMLGKGGFAICYQGYLLPTRHKYALKIVKSQMPSKMQQKFQTELQIHSKMRNKNIVQFLRAFSYENCTYLVLELCPNGSLMDMVKKRRGLTEPEVRFYSVQVAGAIKYMHDKGIIHRDLKMGNIFLDRNMNAKVGDFGLAALLVTGKDMHTIRRTTLCGTPNYIAPEILEKGKKGHDHMVDIWSLGIIMFAMLTSKPPFQSTSTEEIYRRARERDYEWPSSETTQKYISLEAKDIVASMLEDADRRPDPDTIVQHPFFTSGYMPVDADMTPKLLTLPPDDPHFYTTRLDSRLRAASVQNLKGMCNECGVGPWSQHQVIHTQTWKEMAAEEKAGLTPAIPLAPDVVYRPFDQWLREQKQHQGGVLSHSLLRSQGRPEPHLAASQTAPSGGLMRAPPQSFAAQQRAQSRPAALPSTARVRTQQDANLQAAQTVRPGVVRQYTESEPEPEQPTKTLEHPPQKTSTVRKAPLAKALSSMAVMSLGSSSSSNNAMTAPSQTSRAANLTSLFSPSEHPVPVSGSQPDIILDRLRRLQAELERALNARTMAIISAKDKTPPHPHVVVKWVDYSNKFGLGYILNNGSVGCVLRDIPTTDTGKLATLPSACMLVRNAERHIERRQDETYPERHQPVPPREKVHFFESNGEAGLNRVSVPARQFRVPVNEDGTAGKLNPGADLYEHRKRERVILWKKFANYMIAYGRDETVPSEDDNNNKSDQESPEKEDFQPDDLVTFYQRIGDVGCWVFCDGHLQFNFPDHTKIVLNATGTWCHFWHLPEEAALNLAENGTLTSTALDERAMLSYPLQTLLNFQTKPSTTRSTRTTTTTRRRPEIPAELQGIPAANDFRPKIEFIKNVVKEWVTNGGLGNSAMSRQERLRWTGYRETVNVPIPTKMVWVTVGARWGDKRRSAYVDPRKPSELGEEIDESKRKERTQSGR
ncbi:serine/threonine-protein kinase plo1 [Sodiomyces alkalinus F11]|uniref:Serine/threonine-protein kinase plo1 n=1 Tax=Sodiomyces alkalinus (strain CBS 110278 / VKM F-3762 / F11) TaxID=1314773 RepID=A0A3N2PZT2_SODAK|nr:serine/threonine-protein kinase plo1 [Sodiomyces alkalinus F11]ROT40030.1 serine/threonine-protein kinase plo1 [Sodiomyces alkalinus F11]